MGYRPLIRHFRPLVGDIVALARRPRSALAAAAIALLSTPTPAISQIVERLASPAASIADAGGGFAAPAAGRQSAAEPTAEEATRMRQLTEIGARYENAEGVDRDLARAHSFYCDAARAGSTDALVRLGWMYANGRGVARDDTVASTLFRRAGAFGSEVGRQLSQMVRSFDERLPECLGGAIARETVQPATVLADEAAANGPTPRVENPARFDTARPSSDRRRIASIVVRMAREFRIDPRLVLAIMQTESNFDPTARSSRNAHGLMQLIPETAERFAVANLLDPVQNIRGGMAYLRWLLAYFRGDVVLTIAAYNAGEGAVDRFRGVPPFAETMAYVQRIRAMYPNDRHSFDPRIAAASPALAPDRRAAASRAAASSTLN